MFKQTDKQTDRHVSTTAAFEVRLLACTDRASSRRELHAPGLLCRTTACSMPKTMIEMVPKLFVLVVAYASVANGSTPLPARCPAARPPHASPPLPPAAGDCSTSTCSGADCDYWSEAGYTCSNSEDVYACDCG